MSLAHELIDAALAADLSQNALRVFLALFRQTLCYGKTSDPLSLKRLAQLTHIRKDRVLPAVQVLLEKGLFTAQAHRLYGQTYSIHPQFLTQTSLPIYAPHLPKKRQTLPKSAPISEKRVDTTNNQTTSQPNNLDTANDLPYPPSFNAQQRQTAAQWLDGLSPHNASDCLRLLQQALQLGKVRSPLGYLHTLIQAARQNRLDRSTLPSPPQPTSKTPTTLHPQLQELTQRIQHIDQLYQLANQPMDLVIQQQRSQWLAELAALKRRLPT
jgi:phage replication O-like protein O